MEIVLNTFGSSINRDNEGFVVTTQEGRQRIPVVNVSAIRIGKSAQITSDAVLLAIENEIEVFFTDRAGNVIGRIWSSRYGSISTIRKGQLAFSKSKAAVDWLKHILSMKMDNQQAMLLLLSNECSPFQNQVNVAVNHIEEMKNKVNFLVGDSVTDVAAAIRGFEGNAAKIYFDTMNLFLPDEFKFQNRSQHPAVDVTNALLNYGYGILYGKIENALILAGIDPYVGILHRDEYKRPVLVYDVIELYRIWIDYVVWSLIMQKAVTPDYYSLSSDGSCWLESLGRRVIIQSVSDYLDETIKLNGVIRSRKTHIDLYAQNLAQTFKKYQ